MSLRTCLQPQLSSHRPQPSSVPSCAGPGPPRALLLAHKLSLRSPLLHTRALVRPHPQGGGIQSGRKTHIANRQLPPALSFEGHLADVQEG